MLSLKIIDSLKAKPAERPIPNWLVYSSVFFVMVAVFIKLWTPISLNRWPEAFYSLTFFYGLYKERQWLWKHPMVLGLFAAIIATPVLFLVNYLQDPIRAVEYAHFEKLIRVYLFLPIAYWLSFNRNYIYWFLSCAFLGLITACLLDPNLARTVSKLIQGERVSFGLKNAQHTALWGGLFLIWFLCLMKEPNKIPSKTLRFALRSILFLCICISFFFTYTAETRAAFIGLICVMLYAMFLYFSKNFRSLKKKHKVSYIAICAALTLGIGSIIFFTNNPVKERFQNEHQVISTLLRGDLADVPNSSIGIRIHSWVTAIAWIKQKPFVGWGGKVRQHVIDSVPNFDKRLKEIYGHLHNTYLEFLVAYGMIGLIVAMMPLLWVFTINVFESDYPLYMFAILGNFFFILVSLFESYLFFWPGVFTLGLYLSPLLALHFRHKAEMVY